MIDFPNSPTVGQQFTAAGVTWTWDGTKWLPSGLAPTVVPGINDNRIINGDMRIDQRNGGAAGVAGGYTVDRWQYSLSQAGKGTWQQKPSAAPGFPYHLSFISASVYAVLAGDSFVFYQPVEADAISDFQWGTANAQPVTLSFWAFSSLSGTFGGSVRNAAGTRSYPFAYTLPAPGWMKVVINIPADASGTWVMSGSAASLWVVFGLGVGSTYSGPSNAWASTNYLSVTGAVSVVSATGATFFVTGVKLEIGSVATPYNRQSLAKSLADCQRYYSQTETYLSGYNTAGSPIGVQATFPVQMRANPTIVVNTTGSTNIGTVTSGPLSPRAAYLYAPVTATGTGTLQTALTLSAEL